MSSISNKDKARQTGADRNIRAALGVAGARVTAQRALILEIIHKGRGHLSADEIYRRARQQQPRLSLSTVYRTLQALKRSGLVEEIHLDDNLHHYESKPAAEHHHMICLGCGRVVEFQYPLSRTIKQKVAAARDFDITGAEVRLTGYCPQCQKGDKRYGKEEKKGT